MADIGIAPPDSVMNAVQDAQATGDVNAMKAIAPLVANTSMADAVNGSIKSMDGSIAPGARIVAQVNNKGGIQTPEGRLSLADSIKSEYGAVQPPKSLLKGIGLTLIGDPNAYKAFNPGVQENFLAPGDDGKFYRVEKNTNSGIPSAVYDQNGNAVPLSVATKLGITKFNTVNETTGFQTNLQRAKDYASANVQEIAKANGWASGYQTIDNNNKNIIDGLTTLKSAGVSLPTDVLTSINSIASKTGAIANSYSSALNNLAQANDSTSINNAIGQANALRAQLGMPKIVSMDGDHKVTTDDGKTSSITNLLSESNNVSNSKSSENAWRAGAEQIKNEVWYKNLAATKPELIPVFENIYNQSANNDLLKKSLSEQYGGQLPIASPTVPFDPAKSLESNIANSFIEHANAQHAQNYAKQLGTMLQGGVPIVPGSVMKNYAEGQNASAINNDTIAAMKQVLSSFGKEKPATPNTPTWTGTQLDQKSIASLIAGVRRGDPDSINAWQAYTQKYPQVDQVTSQQSSSPRINQAKQLDVNAANPAVKAVSKAEFLDSLIKKHTKGAK